MTEWLGFPVHKIQGTNPTGLASATQLDARLTSDQEVAGSTIATFVRGDWS